MTINGYEFDRFLRYDEMVAWLNAIATKYPKIVSVESYGKSHKGRDLMLATITDTATGAHHALVLEMPGIVAVLMGLITGVAGGVLRDVVCNQIPAAFHDHRPYAVCAFAGGWSYVALWTLQAPGWVALLGCVLVTAGLRGLALWRNWQLPAWRI